MLFDYKKIGGYQRTVKVELDSTLENLSQATDYTFSGESSFLVPEFEVPNEFSLGVIYGSSGTGKSTLLQEFGNLTEFTWDSNKAIASQVDPNLLMRLGLSSIPSLCRPYHVLSTGEKHRADIAVSLKDGCIIDEFTSVCNRDLAVEGRSVRQSSEYRIIPCSTKAWAVFKNHHYLSSDINAGAHCWLMLNDKDHICGFSSAIPSPGRDVRNAWREHRTVILPDYQGLGLGSKLSDTIAQMYIDKGCRYFSKTAHPKLGEHRNRSSNWKPTSMNNVSRKSSYMGMASSDKKRGAYTGFDYNSHAERICYSHEYIGEGNSVKKETTTPKYQQETLF
ncbi:GNAT family N-acetyltransferase [bacterium]|nr:GNAT family N-acetyltransferase [bacterium]